MINRYRDFINPSIIRTSIFEARGVNQLAYSLAEKIKSDIKKFDINAIIEKTYDFRPFSQSVTINIVVNPTESNIGIDFNESESTAIVYLNNATPVQVIAHELNHVIELIGMTGKRSGVHYEKMSILQHAIRNESGLGREYLIDYIDLLMLSTKQEINATIQESYSQAMSFCKMAPDKHAVQKTFGWELSERMINVKKLSDIEWDFISRVASLNNIKIQSNEKTLNTIINSGKSLRRKLLKLIDLVITESIEIHATRNGVLSEKISLAKLEIGIPII